MLGLVLSILGWLFASFTVFTAISIFGVFLGTGAPVIVLSVMSGFESDLKRKILGTKADVVISAADDAPFTDYERGAREDRAASTASSARRRTSSRGDDPSRRTRRAWIVLPASIRRRAGAC